jgi:diguanylate cyclase (GGDEF)-like protein
MPEAETRDSRPGAEEASPTPRNRPGGALRGRRGPWAAGALVCVVAGIAASVLGARAVAQRSADNARHSLARDSAQIDARLKLSVAHEEDLAIAASTFFARDPGATATQFGAWVHWARALRRYPELQRLGFVALIRAPAHAYHCRATVELARGGVRRTAARTDRCASTPGLLATRDTAHSVYAATHAGSRAGLEVESPVYRGDQPPAGFTARRAAFVGWLREVWRPGLALSQALAGNAPYAVHLRHGSGSASVEFASGTPQQGAQSATSKLQGGWTVRTFGPSAPSASVFSDTGALELAIGGVLVSLLVGLLVLVAGYARDAEARPSARAQAHEDLYDALTGLPNRALLLDRAERMLARAGRLSDSLVGALFIDIDWFKDINEKLGEAAGDQLLRIVAQRLESVVRTHDTVGRLEGDKFVVLVESAARGMRLDSLARRVMEVLHQPVELDDFGPSFSLTVSIGVAFGRYETPEQLLQDAEQAMHSAEAAGRDRYTLFNANMRSVIEGRGVMELELNAAIENGELFLLYQPIFDLGTRQVVALEALVRWRHPTRGVLSAEEFIPLADETGLIVPIGRWALEQACTQAAAWDVAGHRGGVCIEVSASQINRDGFVTDVRRALQQSGIDPALLTLDVSEATVMRDISATAAELEQIKLLGVGVALQELDGEYAHHSELHRLPLDFLKVDRSSLAASADEDYRNWLLEGIVRIGREHSLPVIATGVESHEQLASLQALGCAMAEGSFMGQARPADNAEQLFDLEFPTAPAGSRPAAT